LIPQSVQWVLFLTPHIIYCNFVRPSSPRTLVAVLGFRKPSVKAPDHTTEGFAPRIRACAPFGRHDRHLSLLSSILHIPRLHQSTMVLFITDTFHHLYCHLSLSTTVNWQVHVVWQSDHPLPCEPHNSAPGALLRWPAGPPGHLPSPWHTPVSYPRHASCGSFSTPARGSFLRRCSSWMISSRQLHADLHVVGLAFRAC
jgi:hypothetical protein